LAHKNFAEQAHPSKQQPYKFSEFSVLSVDKEKILIADQWEKSTAFFRLKAPSQPGRLRHFLKRMPSHPSEQQPYIKFSCFFVWFVVKKSFLDTV
jgi:hypothetical protein